MIAGVVTNADELRARFDIVFASSTGVYTSALPVADAELSDLREHLRASRSGRLMIEWILARADEYHAVHRR